MWLSCMTLAGLQSVRAATVKALTEGTLLMLTRDDFNNLLGSLSDIRHMWRFEALRMVSGRPGACAIWRTEQYLKVYLLIVM